MTDAKQAMELVEQLREGAGRVARHCMRQAEHGDPGLISIPRHERDIDAIMEEAASLISSLAEENERLRGALEPFARIGVLIERYEDFRGVSAKLSALGEHCVAAHKTLTTHPAQPEGEGHDH